jgi:hypothetical protein
MPGKHARALIRYGGALEDLALGVGARAGRGVAAENTPRCPKTDYSKIMYYPIAFRPAAMQPAWDRGVRR